MQELILLQNPPPLPMTICGKLTEDNRPFTYFGIITEINFVKGTFQWGIIYYFLKI